MPTGLVAAQAALPILAPLALHVLLALAACGLPALTASALWLGLARRKAFLDKLAGQTAPLVPVLLLYLTAAWLAVGLALPGAGLDPLLSRPAPLHPFLAVGAGAALAAFLCLLLARRLRRNQKALQVGLAVGGGVAALELLFFLAAAVQRYFTPEAPAAPAGDVLAATAALDAWLGSAFFPPLAAQAVLLAAGLAGSAAAAYVPLRRRRDDYGRDYYSYALKVASAWAMVGLLAQLVPQAWLDFALWTGQPDRAQAEGWAWPMGLALGFGLLAGLLCLPLTRGQTPMRQRFLPWLALLLAWLALICQAALLLTVWPGTLPPPA